MKVRVLYFASVRDLCGIAEEEWGLPEGSTIAALQSALLSRYPALIGREGVIRFACNEAFCALDQGLTEGDTVALIPPVGGG